jgi:hypothetical protein
MLASFKCQGRARRWDIPLSSTGKDENDNEKMVGNGSLIQCYPRNSILPCYNVFKMPRPFHRTRAPSEHAINVN